MWGKAWGSVFFHMDVNLSHHLLNWIKLVWQSYQMLFDRSAPLFSQNLVQIARLKSGMRLSRQSREDSQAGPKMSWESKDGCLALVFIVARRSVRRGFYMWARTWMVWTNHQHQQREHASFPIGFPRGGVRGEKRGVVGLGSCQQ